MTFHHLFDIDPIVEAIGVYLTKPDYANCSLVNKCFNRHFRRLLWRNVSNGPQSRVEPPLDESYQTALLANGHLIRSVRISETKTGNLLKFLATSLSPVDNLQEFHYWIASYGQDSELPLLMDIMEKNSSLRECSIKRTDPRDTKNTYARLFNALSKHPSLRILRLHEAEDVYQDVYRALLQSLPETLQILDIDWAVRASTQPSDSPDRGWRDVYPQLRSLSFKLMFNNQEEETLFPFLHRCPALEQLRINHFPKGTVRKLASFIGDVELFPKLNDIYFAHDTLSKSDWGSLIPAMQGRIKSFWVFAVHISGLRDFVESLTTCWAQTLEVLLLHQGVRLKHIDIEKILTRCPNLKTFSIFTSLIYREEVEGKVPGLEAWFDEGRDSGTKDWVCLELENIEMAFLDVREIYTGDPGAPESDDAKGQRMLHQEECTDKGIKKAFQMLGRLTKLKYLRLGWVTSEAFADDANMDLSFESGLKHLEGLKDLEVLDVSNMYVIDMKQEEFEWMLESWPKLREIHGIQYYEDHEDKKEHLQWLRQQCPDIATKGKNPHSQTLVNHLHFNWSEDYLYRYRCTTTNPLSFIPSSNRKPTMDATTDIETQIHNNNRFRQDQTQRAMLSQANDSPSPGNGNIEMECLAESIGSDNPLEELAVEKKLDSPGTSAADQTFQSTRILLVDRSRSGKPCFASMLIQGQLNGIGLNAFEIRNDAGGMESVDDEEECHSDIRNG
ncbi:hypothetical protein BGX27_009506 [Mortierella sp. AM989]|nr:hypothetical protein BGX27_009506 [Mortierella sp. AM989]